MEPWHEKTANMVSTTRPQCGFTASRSTSAAQTSGTRLVWTGPLPARHISIVVAVRHACLSGHSCAAILRHHIIRKLLDRACDSADPGAPVPGRSYAMHSHAAAYDACAEEACGIDGALGPFIRSFIHGDSPCPISGGLFSCDLRPLRVHSSLVHGMIRED